MGLEIGALEQVAAGLLDPGRLDLGDDAPVLARRLHPLRGDDPFGLLVEEAGAGMDQKAAVARSLILAALVLEADIAQQAGQQGQMEGGKAPLFTALRQAPRPALFLAGLPDLVLVRIPELFLASLPALPLARHSAPFLACIPALFLARLAALSPAEGARSRPPPPRGW